MEVRKLRFPLRITLSWAVASAGGCLLALITGGTYDFIGGIAVGASLTMLAYILSFSVVKEYRTEAKPSSLIVTVKCFHCGYEPPPSATHGAQCYKCGAFWVLKSVAVDVEKDADNGCI